LIRNAPRRRRFPDPNGPIDRHYLQHGKFVVPECAVTGRKGRCAGSARWPSEKERGRGSPLGSSAFGSLASSFRDRHGSSFILFFYEAGRSGGWGRLGERVGDSG